MIIKEVFNKWFDFKMVRIFLCEVKITSEDHMEGRAHGPRAPLHFISFKIACMHALLENQTMRRSLVHSGGVPLIMVGPHWRSFLIERT